MIFNKEFEFEFDYYTFCDCCIANYGDNFEISDLLNDTLAEKYFMEYCLDLDWCDAYESATFIENKKEIISEIQFIVKERCEELKVENKTSMEEEIQNEIKSNYNFEVLIQTIMNEYYSQGYQIEKIENQIASACIAKINQISWQKAINALKN